MVTPVFSAAMESEKIRKYIFDREARTEPVLLPGSKSIAARALVLSYVYGHRTRLAGVPECDDTKELERAMKALCQSGGDTVEYDLGTGGTSLRFFLALAASLPGKDSMVDCSDALRKRPLSPLINSLRQAGADIECLGAAGCAPLRVRGKRLSGRNVSVDTDVSSQFASALLMVSPLWSSPFVLPEGMHAVSRPYIDMTRRMVDVFSRYPSEYCIEADWSAASYFYEYALLCPGREVIIKNMPPLTDSLQGDSTCTALFGRAGVYTEIDREGVGHIYGDPEKIDRLRGEEEGLKFDLQDTPDLVPALVAGLCCAGIRFSIVNVAHLRHKESDRLASLKAEMAKAGYEIELGHDHLAWRGNLREAGRHEIFDARGDHRMAMALTVAAVSVGRVDLFDAGAVTKSFPDFYTQTARLGIYGCL